MVEIVGLAFMLMEHQSEPGTGIRERGAENRDLMFKCLKDERVRVLPVLVEVPPHLIDELTG